MATDFHSVSDLPTSAREALAAAAGLPLDGSKQFYVVVLNSTEAERRDRAWAEMQRIAATAQRNIESRGLPAHEFEALVDDVCREIRHGHDA